MVGDGGVPAVALLCPATGAGPHMFGAGVAEAALYMSVSAMQTCRAIGVPRRRAAGFAPLGFECLLPGVGAVHREETDRIAFSRKSASRERSIRPRPCAERYQGPPSFSLASSGAPPPSARSLPRLAPPRLTRARRIERQEGVARRLRPPLELGGGRGRAPAGAGGGGAGGGPGGGGGGGGRGGGGRRPARPSGGGPRGKAGRGAPGQGPRGKPAGTARTRAP